MSVADLHLRARAALILDRRRSTTWRPNPGPQTEFVADQETPDVVFGGSRGPGKTVGLLLSFREHARLHGRYALGVLFRRSYVELQEVLRLAKEIYGEAGWSYHETEKRWTSPNGAVLFLRYLDADADAMTYQGWSITWQGFDELQNWPTLETADKLWATLRSVAGIPCLRRSTCNPGGPGHVAVRERYDPDHPKRDIELRPIPDRQDLVIRARFIFATLEDNPKLLEADPRYEDRLAAVGSPALFAAWRYGRWDVIAGQFFDCWNEATMTLAPEEVQIEPWHPRWISADWGFKDPTVVHWHAQDHEKRVVTYRELKLTKTTPDQIAREIVEANRGEKLAAFYLSPDAFAQRTSQRTIAIEMGEVLRPHGLPSPTSADNDRIGGWVLMTQLLLSGHWRISRACPELVNSIPLLQRSDKNPEDVDDSPVDHAPDSARYGLKTHLRNASPPREERVARRVRELMPELADLPALFEPDGRPLDPTAACNIGRVPAIDYTRLAMVSRRAEAEARPWRRPRRRRYGG